MKENDIVEQNIRMPEIASNVTEKELRESFQVEFSDIISSYLFALPDRDARAFMETDEYKEFQAIKDEIIESQPVPKAILERGITDGFQIRELPDASTQKRSLKVAKTMLDKLESQIDAYFQDTEKRYQEYLSRFQEQLQQVNDAYVKAKTERDQAKEAYELLKDKKRDDPERIAARQEMEGKGLALETANRKLEQVTSKMSRKTFEKNLEKAGKVLKAQFGNELKRSLQGDTPAWIVSRDPFADAMASTRAVLNVAAEDLPYRIMATQDVCPIYDVLIQKEELVQKQLAYWKEKKSGPLTKEREDAHRQDIYQSVTELLEQTKKANDALAKPEMQDTLKALSLTDKFNSPFELSRFSARGMGAMEDELIAQKTGLENNWHLEDMGTLQRFAYIHREILRNVEYKRSAKIEGHEKREKPLYQGAEHEAYVRELNQLWSDIEENPLQDAKERNTFLDRMRSLVAKGVEKNWINEKYATAFEQDYQKSRKRDALIVAGKEEACSRTWLFTDTLQPEDEELMKTSLLMDFGQAHSGLASSLKSNFNLDSPDIMTDSELAKEEVYHEMEPIKAFGPVADLDFYAVQDEDAFLTYKKEGKKMVDTWNELIDQSVPEGPDADKIRRLLKASYTNRLERGLEGYSVTYLTNLWPSCSWMQTSVASVYMTVEPEMSEKLRIGEREQLPVHDLIIENDEQITVLTDYLKESENQMLSAEREQLYRQKLHDHAVSLYQKLEAIDKVGLQKENDTKYGTGGLHVLEEEAFCLSSSAQRGCESAKCYLDAQIHGLEQGWAIRDLRLLGAFRHMAVQGRGRYEHNYALSLNSFERYNLPRYPSEECKAYFDKLDAYYEKIKNTPLTDEATRTKIIDTIQSLTLIGMKKGFILEKEGAGRYVLQTVGETRYREERIKKGLERAFDRPVSKESLDLQKNMELATGQAWEKRSIIFAGRESDYHANMRLATDEVKMQKQSLDLAKIDQKDTPQHKQEVHQANQKKAAEYLEALDRMALTAKIYQKKREGAKTGAGKKRLDGARKIERLAAKEANDLIDKLNLGREQKERITLLGLRKSIAEEKGQKAQERLGEIQTSLSGAIKSGRLDKATLGNLVADVLVKQLADSKNVETIMGFEKNGPVALKEQILAQKEFQRMVKGYLDGKKTGADLAADLAGGKCTRALAGISKQMKQEKLDKEKRIDSVKTGIDLRDDPKPKPAKAIN